MYSVFMEKHFSVFSAWARSTESCELYSLSHNASSCANSIANLRFHYGRWLGLRCQQLRGGDDEGSAAGNRETTGKVTESEWREDLVLPQVRDYDHIALAKRKKFLFLIHLGFLNLFLPSDFRGVFLFFLFFSLAYMLCVNDKNRLINKYFPFFYSCTDYVFFIFLNREISGFKILLFTT